MGTKLRSRNGLQVLKWGIRKGADLGEGGETAWLQNGSHSSTVIYASVWQPKNRNG